MRWSSEPGLGKSGQGCKMSVLVVAVGRQAGRDCALGSARMPASGSVAAAAELVEVACAEVEERRRSLSTPTPLSNSSNSTSQRLFAAFLVRFAGGGKGAGGVSGGNGRGGGSSAGGGSGRIGGAQDSDCTAAVAI
jgi:hypothetical protein